MGKISDTIERGIFWSRWLLAPLYVGLVGVLAVLAYKFVLEFITLIQHVNSSDNHVFVLDLLALLDFVLLANLILIVLFAGYENFVSKIEVAEDSVDRPYWMGTVDFSGLKIKLIGSLVAISVIELLKDFIELSQNPHEEVGQGTIWRVIIHLTFVVSGVLFSVMDWISDNRVIRSHSLHTKTGHVSEEHVTTGAAQVDAETGKITKPGSGI
jgi:uncharacterized protein (TIGR00645 family)